MAKKIYALLVGINDYAPGIGKLAGCLNDVDHFHAYLTGAFSKADLAVEVLKDSDATRDNIIKMFRTHLGKAKADDVALFQYCGHGARWKAAGEFKEFYPDGWDEGIVCYDSRSQSSSYPFDLADKELAVLLAEVAANNPHLAVIMDCCHSGSITRDADAFNQLKARQTHEVKDERPLDSYLDGYYVKRRQKGESLNIPTGQHILLAACERTQKALEAPDRSGVFTSTLLEVLGKSGGDITYAELFTRCRSAVRKYADNQNPQFEAYKSFNAYAGFLGREPSEAARRYGVHFDKGSWKIDAGALHGLPTEPEKSVGLALYTKETPSRFAGNASTTVVGPQKSDLQLSFEGDTKADYTAEITSLPVAPIPVYLEGDEEGKKVLEEVLKKKGDVNAIFTDSAAGTQYALAAENGVFLLKQREMDLLIQGVQGKLVQERGMTRLEYSEDSAQQILAILKQVVHWEKGLALQNHSTKMDASLVDFIFAEKLDNGQTHNYPAGEFTLDYVKSGEEWKKIWGKFKVRNRTKQTLHVIFAYFSSAYGIKIGCNEPIPPGDDYVTQTIEGESELYFDVKDGANESIENFKIIVSTEKVDDFLLDEEDLVIGKIWRAPKRFGTVKDIMKYENDWFTKNMRVKVVRQIDQVGAKEAKLKQGKIVVKSHPAVKANLSLSAAKAPSRSAGEGTDFYKAFERQGLEMLNFAGTRGDSESILELTDIENAEALAKNPLEIDVNVPLNADEGILPLVFDGQHVLLGGDTFKDEQGNTHISIDHIPEVPDNRRSVGKALKLYFFKTYLKQDNVNQLCWVEYKDGGKIMRHNVMADINKVNAAQNVVVLVHGIIGDTEPIAKGLRMAGLDQKFDLVLTYDYENLSTTIEETARDLKKRLEAAGFGANDNKKLTLLVHSMGGLVARWFIEREGGNTMVDHLVMCGTPNNGSPFGRVDDARKILNVLTGVAMNYVPVLIPAMLFLLNRSKKITKALEQMDPKSEFITTLNSGGDPRIRYTILAGNVEEYQEPSDQFFPKMLAKAGKGFVLSALFGNPAHDIAVGVESILGIDGSRNPMPKRGNVSCHHLNYFISEPGQRALLGVEW